MPITIDEDTSNDPVPSLATPSPGDRIEAVVVEVFEAQVKDLETGQPKPDKNGNPQKQKCIICIPQKAEGDTVKARFDSEDIPVPTGEICAIWTKAAGAFEYRDGLRQHGPLQVGDIFTWECTSQEKPKTKGYNGRKHRSFTFTRNTDQASIRAAEDAYTARQPAIPADNDSDNGYPDEDPF